MRLCDEPVERREVAEERVHVAVVGHVVPEVGLGRRVERADPHGVDAEPDEVVEAGRDPVEVAHAVAVGVLEGTGVDVVDDAGLPPGGSHGGT